MSETSRSEDSLPVDPDVEPDVRTQRLQASVIAVIAAGGAIGAIARWSIGVALPPSGTGFPWATFLINVSGCLLIGVLMVFVVDVVPDRRLLRPFLGVGVLGGFTTFSTYIVDIQRRLTGGAATVALIYLIVTVVAALLATAAGIAVTRALIRSRG